MNTKDSCIGCITVYRKSKDTLSDHELMLLSIFSAEAVQAVEKAKLIHELQEQATQDPLTHLWNKKAFNQKLEVEIDRSRRHQQNMALIFIDLDKFKSFNDAYGQLMGDKLLHDFTQILKTHCRKTDIIGRFGGDEFVIIAPQTTTDGALNLAEKIRRQTENHHFLTGQAGSNITLSCSIGVAMFNNDDKPDELMHQADSALYTSKRNGRNQVNIYTDVLSAAN